MRLTCPNCGAQYEVPDDVIPTAGRDVQCSNCGNTWFQQSAVEQSATQPAPEQPVNVAPSDSPREDFSEPAPHAQDDAPDPVEARADATDVAAPEPEPDPEPSVAQHQPDPAPQPKEIATPETGDSPIADVVTAEDDVDIDDEPQAASSNHDWEETTDETDMQPAPPPNGAAARPQRGLDHSVTDILREEAQREADLRAAESSGLETQPDLGLDNPPADDLEARARQTRERMARLRGKDPHDEDMADDSGSRRGLLPDIEEINSSLRGDADSAVACDGAFVSAPPNRQRRGFLRGFSVVVILALALVMVYKNADKLAEAAPQARPQLETYVTWVNRTRIWLHTQAEQLAAQPNPPQ